MSLGFQEIRNWNDVYVQIEQDSYLSVMWFKSSIIHDAHMRCLDCHHRLHHCYREHAFTTTTPLTPTCQNNPTQWGMTASPAKANKCMLIIHLFQRWDNDCLQLGILFSFFSIFNRNDLIMSVWHGVNQKMLLAPNAHFLGVELDMRDIVALECDIFRTGQVSLMKWPLPTLLSANRSGAVSLSVDTVPGKASGRTAALYCDISTSLAGCALNPPLNFTTLQL